ncbi:MULTISPECIES: hypothetical protein [unclassified Microbacterium]|uniref:hypothetical protein n=1 Tax=unclassified Microbacterium TaxID=2609290 RepID=UPI00214C6877|nr:MULTISPECIES: hypothetical protein [unclassified Microbacterium]MCR2808870.1 hypothetical protein [Microbacterium sp. zg.B185]WIM18712.1 hypothetical protein QNO12_14125 [Microbacterium sp. zg-B185]
MIGITHVALTTLCTLLMVGLGFLARPGKATALWSTAFIAAMLTAYGTVIAAELGSEMLGLAAFGMMLSAPAFIWAGLRADRGVGSRWWTGVLVAVCSTLALGISAGQPSYPAVFCIAYAAAAVFAALTITELLRRPEKGRGVTVPLLVMSVVYLVVAALRLASITVAPGLGDLAILREANLLGMLVYLVCAIVTLLFLAREDSIHSQTGVWFTSAGFSDIASQRLERAERAREGEWVLVEARLDDAEDLRTAAGTTTFREFARWFEERVRSSFPADADVAALADDRVVVLIARPTETVRQLIRRLLEARDAADIAQDLAVNLSASVGWATVSDFGYDLEVLQHAASTAAQRAVATGGDRAERAVPAAAALDAPG